MPRKPKTNLKQYGVPTVMIAVRVPEPLDKQIEAQARESGLPKSRKVVELLQKGLRRPRKTALAPPESVFE